MKQRLKTKTLTAFVAISLASMTHAQDVALIDADSNSITVTNLPMTQVSAPAVAVTSQSIIATAPNTQTVYPAIDTGAQVSSITTIPTQSTSYVEQKPVTLFHQNGTGQTSVEAGVLSTTTTINTPMVQIDPVTVYRSEYLGKPDYYWSGQRWVYLPAN